MLSCLNTFVFNALPQTRVCFFVHGVENRSLPCDGYSHFRLTRSPGAGALSPCMRSIRVYAGSRISAQLLCKKVTPIYTRSLAFALASVFLLYRALSFVCSVDNPGRLTANIPAAVTILLLSLLVKAVMVLEAKLGSLRVRPLPVICLGGIVAEAGETLRNPQSRMFWVFVCGGRTEEFAIVEVGCCGVAIDALWTLVMMFFGQEGSSVIGCLCKGLSFTSPS